MTKIVDLQAPLMQLPPTPTSRVCHRAYETGGVSGSKTTAAHLQQQRQQQQTVQVADRPIHAGCAAGRPFHTVRGKLAGRASRLSPMSLGALLLVLLLSPICVQRATAQPPDGAKSNSRPNASGKSDEASGESATNDESGQTGSGQTGSGQTGSDKTAPSKTVDTSSKNGPPTVTAKDVTPTAVNLLSRSLQETWELFSSKEDTRLGDVWKVVDSNGKKLLICTGTPKGFLLTKRKYQNFDLSFEWKYVSDPNGNSGVLAFTRNEPRLWPTSMQVQLHQPSAGSIFPSGDATSDNATTANGLALEVGQWNKCRVVARNGKVSVEINGKPAGEVSGCSPSQGSLALQSEGSETHFRNIFIRELPEVEPSIADETSTSLPPTKPDAPGAVETDGECAS